MLSNSPTKKNISKINIILGIILIILIVVISVVVLIAKWGNNSMPLFGLKNKVDTIEVTKQGETNILVYEVDKWVLANHNSQPAKQENVINIFDTLDNLIVEDIVSSNIDKQSVYEVGDKGIQVIMKFGDKVLQSFIVGKMVRHGQAHIFDL